MSQLTFSTDQEVIDALKVLAEREKRSISNFIHVVLTSNPKVRKELRALKQSLEIRRKKINNSSVQKLHKTKKGK